MRHLLLTSYDVTDAKRLRRMFRIMRRYGNHLQYSVFLCELNRSERIRMEDDVREVMDQASDSFLIVDLGPAEGRALDRMDFLGRRPDQIPGSEGPLVV